MSSTIYSRKFALALFCYALHSQIVSAVTTGTTKHSNKYYGAHWFYFCHGVYTAEEENSHPPSRLTRKKKNPFSAAFRVGVINPHLSGPEQQTPSVSPSLGRLPLPILLLNPIHQDDNIPDLMQHIPMDLIYRLRNPQH